MPNEVLAYLTLNIPDYYANQTQRDRVVELAAYLAKKLETYHPDEASAVRILRELVKHQRLVAKRAVHTKGVLHKKAISCIKEASIQHVTHYDRDPGQSY